MVKAGSRVIGGVLRGGREEWRGMAKVTMNAERGREL